VPPKNKLCSYAYVCKVADIIAYLRGSLRAEALRGQIADQKIVLPGLVGADCELYMRRYDLIHPLLSGNKLFKLKGWLDALDAQDDTLISFGGAYSNHLLALAYMGNVLERKTVGIVRGNELGVSNRYLRAMRNLGMELHFVSREEYRKKQDSAFFNRFLSSHEKCAIIPEGGAGLPGVLGASAMIGKDERYDIICVSGGTGTTAAGLILAESGATIVCNQVLKGEGYLREEIAHLLQNEMALKGSSWDVWDQFHLGGYGKGLAQSSMYANFFEQCNGICIDAVYLAKTLMAVESAYLSGRFSGKQRILVLHTGGLGPNESD